MHGVGSLSRSTVQISKLSVAGKASASRTMASRRQHADEEGSAPARAQTGAEARSPGPPSLDCRESVDPESGRVDMVRLVHREYQGDLNAGDYKLRFDAAPGFCSRRLFRHWPLQSLLSRFTAELQQVHLAAIQRRG